MIVLTIRRNHRVLIKIAAGRAHLVTELTGHMVLLKASARAEHVVTHAWLVGRHHTAHRRHLILAHHVVVGSV